MRIIEENGNEWTKLYQRINEKKRDEKENRGYGIWNVNQRIKLYYGEQYGLQIDSIVDKGTSIYIKIPAEIWLKDEKQKTGLAKWIIKVFEGLPN